MGEGDVVARLRAYVVDAFLGGEGAGLDCDTDLVELGIVNSLRAIRLSGWIEVEFGVTLTPPTGPTTLRDMAAMIRERTGLGG